MTEADDDVVELGELDRLFEEVLAGQAPTADAPAWYGDLARLVDGARVAGTPAELAAERDVVARMVDVRLASVGDPADAADAVPAGAALALDDRPQAQATATATATIDPAAEAAAAANAGAPPAPIPLLAAPEPPADHEGGDDAPGPTEDPARLAPSGPYVPRHARGYRAKHAAPRAPVSASPTARDVGRLIAFKAAAVTTAVVVGTVAAAAATTGIVANVVVPVLTDKTSDTPGSPGTTTPTGAHGGGSDDDDADVTVPVPECQLAPVCSPLTPANPTTDPVPSRPTGPTVPTTERPSSSTTTTEAPESTTTTDTTSSTEPDPTTTTTIETPPTTASDPVSTMSASESGT